MVLHKNGKPQVVSVKAGKKVSHGNEKTFWGCKYTLTLGAYHKFSPEKSLKKV